MNEFKSPDYLFCLGHKTMRKLAVVTFQSFLGDFASISSEFAIKHYFFLYRRRTVPLVEEVLGVSASRRIPPQRYSEFRIDLQKVNKMNSENDLELVFEYIQFPRLMIQDLCPDLNFLES